MTKNNFCGNGQSLMQSHCSDELFIGLSVEDLNKLSMLTLQENYTVSNGELCKMQNDP